jgi:hypothetical protein
VVKKERVEGVGQEAFLFLLFVNTVLMTWHGLSAVDPREN